MFRRLGTGPVVLLKGLIFCKQEASLNAIVMKREESLSIEETVYKRYIPYLLLYEVHWRASWVP